MTRNWIFTRSSFSVAVLMMLCGRQVWATSGTWDGGASSGYWTNKVNWSDNNAAYPVSEDTATFSGSGNNRTNINIAGLSAIRYINFSGTGVPSYYIGDWPVNSQTLVARHGSNYRVLSDSKNSHFIAAGIQLGPDTSGNSYTFQNDHAFNALTVYGNIFGAASGGTAGGKTLNVNGVGPVKLLGNISKGGATVLDISVNNTGTTTLSGTNTVRILYLNGGPRSVLDIGQGYTTFTNSGSENILCAAGGTITGTGAIQFSTGGAESYADNRVDDVNATCAINCRITGPGGFELYSYVGRAGTFELNGANDFAGYVVMNAAGTISAAHFGNRGATDSNLGAGSKIRFNSNNDGGPKLKYIGAGETTDRTLEFNSHARIEQAGTGHLVFTTNTVCATTSGLSLTLMGSTAGTAEISGVIVNNSGNVAVYKQGTGLWALSGANLYGGGTFVDGGTLVLRGANGSILSSSGITINAGGMLQISNTPDANLPNRVKDGGSVTMDGGTLSFSHTAGATNYSETVGTVALASGPNAISASQAAAGRTSALTLSGLTRTSGTVDFTGAGLGESDRNRIFINGQSDGPIGAWATVNGSALAAYSSARGVYAADSASYADIAARGDTIVSNPSSNVRIMTQGTTGNNELSDATTVINSLAQNSVFDSTVNTAGKTLRTSAAAVPAGKAALTLGAAAGDGTLTAAAESGSLTLANDGASSLTVNAVIADNAGASSLAKAGAGAVTLAAENTFSGNTAISAGALVLANGNALQNSTVTLGGTPPVFDSAVPGHAFTFGGLSGSQGLILVDNASNPIALTVGKNDDSTTFNGPLSGGGSLTKTGSGTLTLGGANSFSGGLTVNTGSTVVANHVSALGPGPVVNNGTIDMKTVSTVSVSNPKISGAGTNNVTLQTGGTTSYLGADYSEFTGVWNIGVAASGGKAMMNGRDNPAATFVVRTNSTLMVGTGTYPHSATLILEGGNTGESYGQLRLDWDGSWNGPVYLANNISDPANDGLLGVPNGNGYIRGVISDLNGPHPVTKMGNGTLILTASNTYAGATWIKAGAVQAYSIRNAGEPSALGAPTEAADLPIRIGSGTSTGTLTYRGTGDTTERAIVMGGTTGGTYLEQAGNGLLKFTGDITAAVASNKQLRLYGSTSGTGEVAGAISDFDASSTNNLFKTGSGAWVLSGNNTYKGNVVVEDGSLVIRNSGAFGIGPKTAQAANNVNGANPHIHFDGVDGDLTIPPDITFRTSNNRFGALLNEAGNNTVQGPVIITGGDGDSIFKANAGKLLFTGNMTSDQTAARNLRLQGNGDGEIRGTIDNGTLTMGLPVIREVGSGTWTLSGSNTYDAITYANNGTLVIGGASGSINGGVTLGGGTFVVSNSPSANHANRLSDSGAVTLNGGTLSFTHSGGSASYSETAGALTVGSGGTTVMASQADPDQTSTLTFASLARTGGGSVNFVGNGLGAEDNRNRIMFATPPAADNALIGPWALHNGTNLASYTAAQGVIPAGDSAYSNISAKGPSVLPNDATAFARISEEGTTGDIALQAETETSLGGLLQATGWDAKVGLTNGQILKTSSLIIGENMASLTIGTNTADGLLMPLSAGEALSLANYSANTLSVNTPVTNNTSASSLVKLGQGAVRLNGATAYTGATQIDAGELVLAANGTTQALAGAISGAGALVKDGSSRIVLGSANTYNGLTLIREGTLMPSYNTSLGSTLAGTIITNRGTLDVGFSTSDNAVNFGDELFTVSGTGLNGRGAIINSSARSQYNAFRYLTLAGDATFGGEHGSARWDIRNTDSSKPPFFDMNGFTMTKVGSNMVGLTAVPVRNPGHIDIQEGSFSIEVNTSLGGDASNTVTVQGNAAFDIYQATLPVAWSLVLNDLGRFYARYGNSTLQNIWAGPVSLNGTAFLTGANDTQATFAGDISGSGRLVKAGSDTCVFHLTGTNNTYSGGTIVSNSTLFAHHPGSLPGYETGAVTVVAGKYLRVEAGNGVIGWNADQIMSLIGNTVFTTNSAILDIDLTSSGPFALTNVQDSFTLYLRGTNTLTMSGFNTNATATSTGSSQYGEVRVVNGASLTLANGSSNIIGRTVVQPTSLGGTLTVNGPTRMEILYVGNGNGDRARVFINDNLTLNGIILAQNNIANGAVYQGNNSIVEINPTGGDRLNIGHNGGYGYYRLDGGTLRSGRIGLPGSTAANGENNAVFEIFGNAASAVCTGDWLFWGWSKGNGVANLYGGTLAGPSAGNDTTMAYAANNGSLAVLNLLGANALMDAACNGTSKGFNMANAAGNLASIINLNSGTLLANRIRAGVTGTPSLFNFNGGTLKANSGTAYASTFMQGLTAATVYPGGAVIDTTNAILTLNQSLVAPTGLGVGWISVFNPGAGYIAPPVVMITGGSGFGATAVATVSLDQDSPAFGQLTGITVTSPGVGYKYDDALTVELRGGGYTTLGQAGVALMTPNSAAGGLTKNGNGVLTLGGTNTYGGVTTINAGTLIAGHADALPTNAAVKVAGGIYNLNGLAVTNGVITATGGMIVNGTLTGSSLSKEADGTLTLGATLNSAAPIVIGGGVVRLLERDPGLYEGFVTSAGLTSTATNPCTAIQLGTRMANLGTTDWPTNTTIIYSGNIWNRGETNVTWTFAKSIDDAVLLRIDDTTVINDGSWMTPKTGNFTLSPGSHTFDVRFYNGTGGAGIVANREWWKTSVFGFGIDFLGRNETNIANYVAFTDPGDGSLVTLRGEGNVVTNLLDPASVVEVAGGATLDLGGYVQALESLSGGGLVSNGTLTVTGTLAPAGDGALGTLTIAAALALSGTLSADVAGDGSSDLLAVQGNVDLTGASLAIVNPADLDTKRTYTLLSCTGTRSGVFASHNLPDERWRILYTADGDVKLRFTDGTVLMLR